MTNPLNPELAAELMRRVAVDQHARGVREGQDDVESDYEAMRAVDADNTAWLKTVVAEHGWPGHTLVGEEAANAAWLLIQHADRDLPFQLHGLQLLTAAVEAGEALPRHLAYLTDRCQVAQQRQQTYGTQYFDDNKGRFGPRPVVDPTRLDERRATMGLGPHAQYDAEIRARYGYPPTTSDGQSTSHPDAT
ncbi:DUF6624 domain-containing protein [Streptomyces sp. CA-181903]|uniref:DUF6624 domain-containing protein n=1 Tax=Streptomyces sp. CA-181903 TaxID=3240055 RepID=UPI003D905B8E